MPQANQIVPMYNFPYVETHINDYTVVNEPDTGDTLGLDGVVRFIVPFASSKGPDNVLVRKASRGAAVAMYGNSNFKKYGQPLMQMLDLCDHENTEVWCMRVMPENATYSNNSVSIYYHADTASDVATASERKFRVKLVQKTLTGEDGTSGLRTVAALRTASTQVDGPLVSGKYVDDEGYTQAPGAILAYSAGRGKYGNAFRLRITTDYTREENYGFKVYRFDVLDTTNGLHTAEINYGSIASVSYYGESAFINDVIVNNGVEKNQMIVEVNEDSFEAVYDAYVAWLEDLVEDLRDEYADKVEEYEIPEGMLAGTERVTAEYADKVAELNRISSLIAIASEPPAFSAWDVLYGRLPASENSNPFMVYPAKLTADIDTEAEDFNELDYTESDIVEMTSLNAIRLSGGSDGYFDTPRVISYENEDGETVQEAWTLEQEYEECYRSAFNGTYDPRILSAKRVRANALFDANYPWSVKMEMADLAEVRNDGLCFLDAGIIPAFSSKNCQDMIEKFSAFNDMKISKNMQHYVTIDPADGKRVTVTISYFLAGAYANHVTANGSAYIPFVKANCQLVGHIRDSIYPTVDDYEVDLKEMMVKNRINFFETIDDNLFQRATQNTSQGALSDLLEENNVATMYEAKRILELDITNVLYDFTSDRIRAEFSQYETAKFEDWIGTRCENMNITFDMSEYEARHSILHCYLAMTFRALQKQAILEIDINPREAAATSSGGSTEQG